MSLRDQKMKVLWLLGQESKPVSSGFLLNQLGNRFTERSLRRWLNQLVKEGSVLRLGRGRATKYLIASQRKELLEGDVSSCFSSKSLKIIEKIRRPMFERLPIPYQDAWLESYYPGRDYYLPKELRDHLVACGSRSRDKDPAGTYAHQIFNRLLIDLSYNSSRLEGNTYSRLETERLLLGGDSADGKLDEERVMILNHKEAICYLVDQASKLHVDLNTICTLHYLLSDGLVLPTDAGKVRNHSVRIGGSVYQPYEDPKRLKKLLESVCTKAAQIPDPFEQSFFLLVHISYVQGFSDVNKRTARLAANIPLIQNNLVPLAFSDIQREDYMSAIIAVYELQNVSPAIDLFIYSYLRTCAAYDTTIKAMGVDEVRVRYRQERREMIRKVIMQDLHKAQLHRFLEKEVDEKIERQDRSAFIEDILEDLDLIDESRIAGLGITVQQLNAWKEKLS